MAQANSNTTTESETPAQEATFPITISVSPGEDMASIAVEIYGFSNDELFSLIQKQNPNIPDLKNIKIGDRIILPALPREFDKFRDTAG